MSELRVDKIIDSSGSGAVEFSGGIIIPPGQSLSGTASSTTNIPNLTGDVSSVNTTTTLATVNTNIGTYGSSTSIPIITVNAKGLVTGVTTNAITVGDGALSLATSGTGLSGSASFSANQSGASAFTVTSNATSDNTNGAVVSRNASGGFSAGIITATSLIGGNASVTLLNATGISTIGNLKITPIGTGATVGSVGIVTYYGDGSNLTGVSAAGYQFNVGIQSAVSTQLTAIGSNVLTLPSTIGKRYIIHSINASNVAVGNTEVNVIGAFDISGGERNYFAYNIPIPTGTSVELLKQPQVLNPSDIIAMRGTDYNRNGSDSAVQIYISYEVKNDTNYFGVGVGTVGIAVTDPTTIYTSTTYPSVIQSIRLTNRTDSGDYPVSITITSGITTTYIIDDLIVPKYGSVELLDTPKALTVNNTIQVIVDQTQTIDVQLSGIKVVT